MMTVLRSYMSCRETLVPTDGGVERLTVTAGVPQGSVLGPTLWNILYASILRLDLPAGIELVAYADDLAVIGSAMTIPDLERVLSKTVDLIQAWMRENGLSLAPQKTEALMLTKRKYADLPVVEIDGHRTTPDQHLNYLRVTFDGKLKFTRHIKEHRKEPCRRRLQWQG